MRTIAKKEKVFDLAGIDPTWKYIQSSSPRSRFFGEYPYWITGNGTPIIFDSYRGLIFFPSQYPTPSADLEEISLGNWKITKVSGEKPYIRNEYARSTWNYNVLYETGVYEVEDTLWGSSYQIQLLCWDEEYDYQTFLRTPIKVHSVLGSEDMLLEDRFYGEIFKYNGESYKVAHINS